MPTPKPSPNPHAALTVAPPNPGPNTDPGPDPDHYWRSATPPRCILRRVTDFHNLNPSPIKVSNPNPTDGYNLSTVYGFTLSLRPRVKHRRCPQGTSSIPAHCGPSSAAPLWYLPMLPSLSPPQLHSSPSRATGTVLLHCPSTCANLYVVSFKLMFQLSPYQSS